MKLPIHNKLYDYAWICCAVTLPWSGTLNNISLFLLALAWISCNSLSDKWKQLQSFSWAWLFFIFFGIHAMGLLFTQNMTQGLFELEKKIAFVLLPLFAVTGKPWEKDSLPLLQKTFIYSCLGVIAWNFTATLFYLNGSSGAHNFDPITYEQFRAINPNASAFWEYVSYIQLGKGTQLHPAYFSMYLTFCCALLVQRIFSDASQKILNATLFILFTVFILLLASRSALFAYCFIIISIIIYYRKDQLWKGIATTAILIFLLAVGIAINPVARFRVIQEPLQTNFELGEETLHWNSVNTRLLEWKASFDVISKNFLLGVGTGDGQAALESFYKNFSETSAQVKYNAHNQFLQTMVELGFIGLLSLLACLFVPLFLHKFDSLQITFVVLFALACLTECMLARQKGIVFFTLFQSAFLAPKSIA